MASEDELLTTPPDPSLTPMLRQYYAMRAEVPDAILFFRMGDFYELFDDDAERAASILGITLTKRQGRPMCGVPYHAKDPYVRKVVDHGLRVAICEQTEDPAMAKGLVQREIVEIISPGTYHPEDLDAPNRYLLSIHPANEDGLPCPAALLDTTTGELILVSTASATLESLRDHWLRYPVQEVLVPEKLRHTPWAAALAAEAPPRTYLADSFFRIERGWDSLRKRLKVATLESFHISNDDPALGPAAAALAYAEELARAPLTHLQAPRKDKTESTLRLGEATLRHLELVESPQGETSTLRYWIDETLSPMGKRLLRQRLVAPFGTIDEIQRRHDGVEALMQDSARLEAFAQALTRSSDGHRLATRLASKKCRPRELQQVASLCERSLLLADECADDAALSWLTFDPSLAECAAEIRTHVEEEPAATVVDGPVIRAGASAELDDIRRLHGNSRDLLTALESEERAKTGINNLKLKHNRMLGWFIEVTKSQLDGVPETYIRRQSMANASRFTNDALSQLEKKLSAAESDRVRVETELWDTLLARLQAFVPAIQAASSMIAECDLLHSAANTAKKWGWRRPHVLLEGNLRIEGLRHPVVEASLPSGRFIPNNIEMGEDQAIIILTGPNMAGKSTYLRQIALAAILTQMGCFIPAESADMPLFDAVFTRIGASDNLARGQSTFLVEMVETSQILHAATSRSLVIMDEIGRGTSTYDGMSIAWSILEHFASSAAPPKVLFATHYHELSQLDSMAGVANFRLAVEEVGDTIVFTHRVERGAAWQSYGLEVARLAGVPDPIVERAAALMRDLERHAPRPDSTPRRPRDTLQQIRMF